MTLSWAQVQDLAALWPGWTEESGNPPPQPDYFVAIELAQDLGVSLFQLTDLPPEPPFLDLAVQWGLIRRQALGEVAKIQAAAHAPPET